MNAVRHLRAQAGLTQKKLAALAGTSQAAIAYYESGAKSPTLATLKRLSSSVGLELSLSYQPILTREDQRSLAYHRTVADKLRENPTAVLKRARHYLARLSAQHPEARKLFKQWQSRLHLPLDELISAMLDPGMTARELRQVTPFAGVLSPRDRVRILKRFQKEYRYETA